MQMINKNKMHIKKQFIALTKILIPCIIIKYKVIIKNKGAYWFRQEFRSIDSE